MTRVKIKKGKASFAQLDAEIIKSGVFPEALEVDLEDYLEIAGLAGISHREDGLYYKGIRLIVK